MCANHCYDARSLLTPEQAEEVIKLGPKKFLQRKELEKDGTKETKPGMLAPGHQLQTSAVTLDAMLLSSAASRAKGPTAAPVVTTTMRAYLMLFCSVKREARDFKTPLTITDLCGKSKWEGMWLQFWASVHYGTYLRSK